MQLLLLRQDDEPLGLSSVVQAELVLIYIFILFM